MSGELSASSQRRVADVLAGRLDYDELWRNEQAAVRSAWQARIDERLEHLDLVAEFKAQGRSWVGLDDAGQIIEYTPTPSGAEEARAV